MFPRLHASLSGVMGNEEERTRLDPDGHVYGSGQGVDLEEGEIISPPPNTTNNNNNTSSESSQTANPSEQPPALVQDQANGGGGGVPYDDAVEDVVTSLTRRVRCLFSIITWPIVPLGTIASLALAWLIYASFVLDVGKTCSHPLHWYAVTSMVLVLYAPYHGRIRSYLFNYYQRERGAERPPGVRRYDQLFHTLALIYVYAGITLVQTCRDDISVLNPEAASGGGNDLDLSAVAPTNTCSATCPNLFAALRVYVATIEIFTFSLILPLLFLPCLYLYFIRRTMQDAESLAALQDRFREEEALMRNGGVTTEEIMEEFERVQLILDSTNNSADEARILVVKGSGADTGSIGSIPEECSSKECCICMEAFTVQEQDPELGGSGEDNDDQHVIRTRTCGHMFHKRCIASWVGGRWQNGRDDNNSNDGDSPSRRARRTTCPLCRQDVRPNRR